MKSTVSPPVSVVILAFNSAGTIGMVLESVKGISDDIVVMDSGSTDQTREICEGMGVRWIFAEWKGYSENKNLGNSLARHNWILSIDSDEVVTSELADSILSELKKDPKQTAFKIRFRSVYCGHRIRFGGWNPEYHVRLFDKTTTRWNTAEVHEQLELAPGTRIKELAGRIEHHSFPSKETHRFKNEKYATLFARRMFERGKSITLPVLYVKLAFQFLKEYVFKLGFLDGIIGFELARMNVQYTWLKYMKLRELHANSPD